MGRNKMILLLMVPSTVDNHQYPNRVCHPTHSVTLKGNGAYVEVIEAILHSLVKKIKQFKSNLRNREVRATNF